MTLALCGEGLWGRAGGSLLGKLRVALGEARVHGSLGIEAGQHLLVAEASEKCPRSQP